MTQQSPPSEQPPNQGGYANPAGRISVQSGSYLDSVWNGFKNLRPEESVPLSTWFSYGSNLFKQDFERKMTENGSFLSLSRARPATLRGWCRSLDNESSTRGLAYTVREDDDSSVEGIAHDVPPSSPSKSLQQESKAQPDHLFMSYAIEDGVFARWLTLRLVAEGYRVWCYETKLLGGEIYPRDIRKAINESTFRMLAVISKSSVDKEHPLQERMLGESVGGSRHIDDFVIPLNLDGTKLEDLDLHTSAALYIPFYKGWAAGLAQLLAKLQKVSAPKALLEGKQVVVSWIDSQSKFVKAEQERIWSNIIHITNFPKELKRYYVTNIPDSIKDNWPTFAKSKEVMWAFGPPGKEAPIYARYTRSADWTTELYADDLETFGVATGILRQTIQNYSIKRGLKLSEEKTDIYFPFGLLPEDKLTYKRYDGKALYVKVVGRKTIKSRTGERHTSWYHIAPVLQPIMNRFGNPSYQLNFRLVWTDKSGVEERVPTGRRRLKWYNYQWLARTAAVIEWLTESKESQDIFVGDGFRITISGKTLDLSSSEHIDEESMEETAEEADDENEEIVEEPEEEENDEEPKVQVEDTGEPN